jgi:hypothetical protein
MRHFTIRKGKYLGEHRIFDSVEEAKKHHIIPKKPWYGDDVKAGDWAIADDGYILQCLDVQRRINKAHRSGQYTQTFRFCNGTFYYYVNANGLKNVTSFFGQIAQTGNRNALGNSGKFSGGMNIRKRKFLAYIESGMEIFHAYIKAFTKGENGGRPPLTERMTYEIDVLLSDPQIRKGMALALQPLKDALEKQIKKKYKKEGLETLEDLVAKNIIDMMEKAKPETQFHKSNIEFLIRISDNSLDLGPKQLPESKEQKRLKEAEDVSFSEISPLDKEDE